jgi:signal transduction histidine kinase
MLVAETNHLANALSEQDNVRKRITTDAAHELRTPLTAVSSHLEAMIEGVWETTPERLRSCYEEVMRLSSLVADLERLARIENENLVLDKARVDLLEIVGAVGENLRAEIAKKNLSLLIEGDSSFIDADKDRLYQVFTNLLSNAIKYTPEGGHIRLAVEDSAKSGVVYTEDDGIGIPEKELPLVFERFYRTDESRNRKTGGAGIGLAIVKSIVAAHGGTVEARSVNGPGSRFVVTLPKRDSL